MLKMGFSLLWEFLTIFIFTQKLQLMKKNYLSALFLCITLGLSAQDVVQGAYLVTIKTDTNKTANAKLIKK
jgi:uncharacterized membrane protein YjjB (DUF3815 family)